MLAHSFSYSLLCPNLQIWTPHLSDIGIGGLCPTNWNSCLLHAAFARCVEVRLKEGFELRMHKGLQQNECLQNIFLSPYVKDLSPFLWRQAFHSTFEYGLWNSYKHFWHYMTLYILSYNCMVFLFLSVKEHLSPKVLQLKCQNMSMHPKMTYGRTT